MDKKAIRDRRSRNGQRRMLMTSTAWMGSRLLPMIFLCTDVEVIGIKHWYHERKLHLLLRRCRKKNIKINKKKLKLRLKELESIGHIISAEGVKPDPFYQGTPEDSAACITYQEIECIRLISSAEGRPTFCSIHFYPTCFRPINFVQS